MKELFWCGDQPTGGGGKRAARLSLRGFASSLTACPPTRKANCALENIYEPGREIGLRSVDKEGGGWVERGENVKFVLR